MKQYKRYMRLIVFVVLIVALLVPTVTFAVGGDNISELTNCRRIPNGMNCQNEYGVRQVVCSPGYHEAVVATKIRGYQSISRRCVR